MKNKADWRIKLGDGKWYHIDSILPSIGQANERAEEVHKGVVRPARTLNGYVVFELHEEIAE